MKATQVRRTTRQRPLTPAQRLALDKRAADREFQWRLESLLQTLNNPRLIPPERRWSTLNALCCVAGAGYLFAKACGKAAVSRIGGIGLHPDQAAFWAFIDAENARFLARMGQETAERWNAPDYITREAETDTASKAGA